MAASSRVVVFKGRETRVDAGVDICEFEIALGDETALGPSSRAPVARQISGTWVYLSYLTQSNSGCK